MGKTDLYFMSPPGPSWALRGRANFRSHSAPQVDARAALGEWLALADAIETRGGRVVCLVPPPETELTGLPYAAECGQLVEQGGRGIFLLPSMGVPHRRGERELWRAVAIAMGLEPIEIEGTWEAQGDVAWFRGRTVLFYGGRTDEKGVDSARAYFHDALVVRVREPAFHGNMALLPLEAAGKVLACRAVIDAGGWAELERAFGAEALVEVSEDEIRTYATNGLPVGNDWLVPHLTPERVTRLAESWGLRVVRLPMIELCEKAGGASRCLVSHARVDEGLVRLPEAHDYRLRRPELVARA
jgi:N-dimethylarginine dimethylaminohydrolase